MCVSVPDWIEITEFQLRSSRALTENLRALSGSEVKQNNIQPILLKHPRWGLCPNPRTNKFCRIAATSYKLYGPSNPNPPSCDKTRYSTGSWRKICALKYKSLKKPKHFVLQFIFLPSPSTSVASLAPFHTLPRGLVRNMFCCKHTAANKIVIRRGILSVSLKCHSTATATLLEKLKKRPFLYYITIKN